MSNDPADILRYYSEAGLDYGAWSPDYQMHFGYWRPWMAPWRREAMLREMNRQVWRRLAAKSTLPPAGRYLDLGCGLGATTRQLAAEHPELTIEAISPVPWQVRQARQLASTNGIRSRVAFRRMDYRETAYRAASFRGAWAIEAACHAPGLSKEALVAEAARVLEPGAGLVVADGFLKRGRPGPLLQACLRQIYEGWALETFADLPAFQAALARHGFEAVEREEVSWRIAPSVAHVPWVTASFLWSRRRAGERLGAVRRQHVLACVLGIFVGLARTRFGYYLISARRGPG